MPRRQPEPVAVAAHLRVFATAPERHGKKAFVDLQNDVTAADIALAAREGYRSVEHVKRYTTIGMGTDQGKTVNINALAHRSREALGRSIPEVGTTTFRPPYTPVTFGALAGRDGRACSSPSPHDRDHDWHVARGARVRERRAVEAAAWYFPQAGEDMHAAVRARVRAPRATASA